MKKNANQIRKIFPIIFTFVIVLIGMVVYKLNNNKSLKSDDVNILVATSDYVLKNNIAISDEINIPVSLLKKQGYLAKDIYCTEDSYVSVKNVNGEYKYEPSLDCENIFIKVTSNSFYNNYTNSMRAIIETILTYEIEKSTENRTNQNVEVRIVASEPILEVSGWTLINNNTTLVKIYETNISNELVTLTSAANNNKKEQISITVDNIDKVKPSVNGVIDGTTYNTNVTINYSKENAELTAKLNGTNINNNYVVSEDGNYQVVVADDIGNETVVNFTIDKTAPIVNGIENGGYYNQDVIVSFEEGTAILNNKSFISGQVVTEEGNYNFVITDNIGNSNEINFTIDKTKPNILNVEYLPILTNNKTNSDVMVEITYSEPIKFFDGINTEWKISDENNKKIYRHFSGEMDLETNVNDVVSVIDLASNESEQYILNFVIDKLSPIGIVTANPTTLTNGDVELILETNEDVEITNYESANVYQYEEGNLRKYAVKRTENGNFTFNFKDVAGNVGSVTYNVENIDKEIPVVTDIAYSPNLINGYSKEDVIVTVTYNEAITELPVGYEYVIGSNNQITKLYTGLENTDTVINETIKVKDIIGNVSEETSITFTIDKTAPIVTGVEDGKYYNTDVTINFNEETATLNDVEFISNSIVTEEGNYELIVKDAAQNETIINFIIDKTAPIVTGVEEGKYYNTDVTVNFNEGTATLNGVEFISNSVVTEEGNYELIVKDAAQNEVTINFVIDKTAPIVTGVEDGKYYNTDITINFNEGTATLNDVEFISDSTVTEEGNYELIVKDAAQNEITINFVIDKTAPIITGVEEGKYYNTDVTINFNEGTATLNGSEFISNSTVTEEGNYQLIVKDNALNETTINFVIDKTAPTGIVTANPTTLTNGDVELTLETNEDVIITNATSSKVYQYEEGNLRKYAVKRTENGKFTFKFKDVAGNTGKVTYVIENIDKEIPVVTDIAYSPNLINGYSKEDVIVTVTYNEAITELPVGYEYVIGSNNQITKLYRGLENTDTVINEKIKVKDIIGNVSEETSITFTIDKTAPIVTGVEDGKYYNTDVTINFNEGTATINGSEFISNSTVTEEGNYELIVKDTAQNEITINFVIDKTAPIITGVEEGQYYNTDVTINFNEGTATLNGVEFTNGSVVTEEGNYQLIVRDTATNETAINFVIDKTAPTGIVTANPTTLTNGDVELTLETNEDVIITNAASSKVSQYEEGNLRKYVVKRTENGNFSFKFKDLAGNTGRVNYNVENIDKEIPVVTDITYSPNLISGYSKEDVIVTITYNEAITELPVGYEYVIGSNNKITKLYTGLENTDTVINEKIKVKDIIGNVSEETSITFTIDKTAPIVTGVEDGKYYNDDVTISFNEGTATINGIDFINGWKVTLEGEYQLIVRDIALNETIINFTIDKTAPTITGVEDGKHYNKDVTINFNEGTATLNGVNLISGSNVTEEGSYQLIVKDNALNETTINFIIDKTNPNLVVFESTQNGEIEHYSDFNVNVEYSNIDKFNNYRATVNDNFSDNLEIKINGNVDLSKLGPQTIIYDVVDKAGNSSKIIATINVVDTIIPTVDYNISNTNIESEWYNEPIIVKLNSSDIGSGVSKYEYRLIVDGIYYDWQEVEYSETSQFIIDENSSNISFIVRSYDKAGNVSLEKNSNSYKIDTIKPGLTYELQNSESSNNWYNSELKFLINPTDNLSGISNLQYSYSVNGGTNWSEWNNLEIINLSSILTINEQTDNLAIKLRVIDNAQNEFEYVIKDEYKIDISKPIITIYSNDNTYTSDFTVTVEANKTSIYKLPEATVTDNYDKDIEVITSGSVDLAKVGKYEVIYSATDDANNTSKIVMTVEVKDTTSPIIKLIGNSPLKIELGHKYNEPGVVIEDNIDQNLSYSISGDVVNTNKLGTYNIVYTTLDNSGNSASVTRIVEIIPANASGLIEDINNCTSNEDCYVTQVENNYVWYSGFLWRIVKVNNDGSLKLVTEDSVSGFSYDDSSSDFESSYVNKWLNTEFYNSLNNNKNIIVNSKYCIDTLLPTEEYSNETGTNNQTAIFAKQNVRYNCSNTIDLNVGLLTIDEYNILGSENSYLNTKDHFFTMTPSTAKTVWVVQTDGIQKAWNLVSNTYAIRPVITISSNIDFVSGTGTKTNPYRIENDNSANSNDLLTTRYTGEYVKFGNQTWRIVKTTGSSTKLIMDSYYQTKNDYGMLEYAKISYGNNGIYDGSNVENYLNNVVYNDLFTDKEKAVLLKSRWYYSNYSKGIDPLQSLLNQNKFVESYIGLIRIGELMSGTSSTGRVDAFTYWTANYVNDTANNKYAWFISWAGTSGYSFNQIDIRGLRPVINLNSNLTIKSGTGTASDPYILNY